MGHGRDRQGLDLTLAARVRSMTRSDVATCCLWVAFALVGMVWVATRYRHNFYYYDEWKMIDDTNDSWLGIFDGFQGHLESLSFIVYRLQRTLSGLDSHEIVYFTFMVSLAALQLSVAALLRRLGVPMLIALVIATVVTYFGPGAQGMSWEFMLGINFALAFSFLAGFVAVGDHRARRNAFMIAGLLVLAFFADSGVAIFGAVFVGILVVALWPVPLAVRALALPAIAHVAWLLFGQEQIGITTSFDKTFTLANRLVLYSFAGLAGGGENHSVLYGGLADPTIPMNPAKIGVIVFVFAIGCVVWGRARRRLSRVIVVTLISGFVTVVTAAFLIAWKRAFLILPSSLFGSRYLQWLAVFLVVAFVPAITAALRTDSQRSNRVIAAVAVIAMVGVFALNFATLRPARKFNEAWADGTRLEVSQVVSVLTTGCGPDARPDSRAEPSNLSPQITVRLMRELLADGSLVRTSDVVPPPEVVKAVCDRER
ncbi:MAG: hypothetical protein EXQ79_10695 [Acidimicrobiia bacterium]|nr:hypothetical protein [Acidimicrobiia bacterium]